MFFCFTGEEFDLEVNDTLMRFFEQCARFVAEVENNKTSLVEVDLFHARPEMKRTFEKIADRLQVPYSQITTGLSGSLSTTTPHIHIHTLLAFSLR